MRIPSQFNEDNLYRRRNRRGDSANSYRRLIRMLIALALVVVVMRQAARPAIYEVFFGDPATGTSSSTADGVAMVQAAIIEEPEEIELDAETRLIANQLTAALSPGDQLQWLATLSRWQASRPIIARGIFAEEAISTTITQTLGHLDSIEGLSEEGKNAWREIIESIPAHVSQPQASVASDPDVQTEVGTRRQLMGRPQLAGWIKALDDAATSRVVDGSVWQSADFDAFYRFLDQANRLSDAEVVSIGVLPLLQQPDVYRNQRVRFAGTVARAEQVDATDNPFGIEQYWRLWLRPRDGADRPLVAIVPAVPTLVSSVGPRATELEGPAVTMVGRFLKRLPYRSSVGADLAPVVIGRLVTVPVTEAELAVEPILADNRATSNRLWLTVAAAIAIGLFLAAVTIWQTSAMEKRARELRVSHRIEPDEFLEGLGSATSETETANVLKDDPIA